MGPQLSAARYSGAGYVPAAQAARQPTAQRHQVLLHGGRFGTSEGSLLADKGDKHHQSALALAEFPEEKPSGEWLAEQPLGIGFSQRSEWSRILIADIKTRGCYQAAP